MRGWIHACGMSKLAPPRRRRWPYRLRLLRRNPLVTLGAVIVLLYSLAALAAPLLAPHPPLTQYLEERLEPPSAQFPLGLDQLGRDIFSRLLFGARLSLMIGLVVVVIAGVLGTVVGMAAGFAGGRVDHALMRVTDIFFAFPSLILAMAIAAALGPSLTNAMIAIAMVTWPVYARLSRAQTLVLPTGRPCCLLLARKVLNPAYRRLHKFGDDLIARTSWHTQAVICVLHTVQRGGGEADQCALQQLRLGERVARALQEQHRHCNRIEVFVTQAVRLARRMERITQKH